MSDQPLSELRAEWEALATAETLHLLPIEALIASIRNLAGELLSRTANQGDARFVPQAFVDDLVTEAVRVLTEAVRVGVKAPIQIRISVDGLDDST